MPRCLKIYHGSLRGNLIRPRRKRLFGWKTLPRSARRPFGPRIPVVIAIAASFNAKTKSKANLRVKLSQVQGSSLMLLPRRLVQAKLSAYLGFDDHSEQFNNGSSPITKCRRRWPWLTRRVITLCAYLWTFPMRVLDPRGKVQCIGMKNTLLKPGLKMRASFFHDFYSPTRYRAFPIASL